MSTTQDVGPLLFFRDWRDGVMTVACVIARPHARAAPVVAAQGQAIRPVRLCTAQDITVFGYTFALAASPGAGYSVDGAWYPVTVPHSADLRIAYVACNGQENHDLARPESERNVLWERLRREHQAQAFHLLLQGGDQIYADEMVATDPVLRAWAAGMPTGPVDPQALREHLRGFLIRRYCQTYGQGAPAWMMARVPSLCMWDDHDIYDGWGSLPAEQLDSPVGREVFEAAREFFLLFQLGSAADDLPGLCLDPGGRTLTWSVRLPGLGLVAPDLRSERRPNRVMGPAGWEAFKRALAALGEAPRIFVLSSVPALGPRLSWIEAAARWLPGIGEYRDDLRDQWQSRAHRDEWRDFLRALLDTHQRGCRVSVLSGEIHLATRGTMASPAGDLHQLVASGIAHPAPPQGYARALSLLARLGEAPLPEHPITLHPLPGQRRIYTAQRNYLVLERTNDRWQARWELEEDGSTPMLDLGAGALR